MNVSKNPNLAPCIINEGTIYHKKDMLRALETFEGLDYHYIVDGKTVASGSGDLIKVFASKNSATMIVNDSVFINVLSFSYLNFKRLDDSMTEVELIAESRSLKLISIDKESSSDRITKEIQPTIGQFADEETFALLEENEAEDED